MCVKTRVIGNNLLIFKADYTILYNLPFADKGIRSGFPAPTQDYIDQTIDLNKELVKHPVSTVYVRVAG